jgi:hypothetical protein
MQAEAKRLAELIASKETYVTCLFNNAGELPLSAPNRSRPSLISSPPPAPSPLSHRYHWGSFRVPREA